jgi:predicted transcriptional regulator
MRKINENNQMKYESKVEGAKAKKMVDMKLDKIAEMIQAGRKQREIAQVLGMSQQAVSYRVSLIKTNYPELLKNDVQESNLQTKIQTKSEDLQTNSNVYKRNKNEILLK